jgi:hypothetical protein
VRYGLANGDVRMEFNPVCFATGSVKPSGGVPLLLGRLPIDSPSMGFLWARLEAGFEQES